MFERFTDGARSAVSESQEVARERGDKEITVEHLLLALTYPKKPDAVSEILSKHLGGMKFPEPGEDADATYGHIPFTSDVKRVMERALREALRLGHNYIGSGHMLLAMSRMRDRPDVGALFNSYGMDPVVIGNEVEQVVLGVGVHAPGLLPAQEEQTTLDTQGKRHTFIKGIMHRLETGPPLSDTDLVALKLLAGHLGIRDFG